jgi:hypothetical protein
MQHLPMVSVAEANQPDLEYYASSLKEDGHWLLAASVRASDLKASTLEACIKNARNQDFMFDYDFARRHGMITKEGLPTIVQAKVFKLVGNMDDED